VPESVGGEPLLRRAGSALLGLPVSGIAAVLGVARTKGNRSYQTGGMTSTGSVRETRRLVKIAVTNRSYQGVAVTNRSYQEVAVTDRSYSGVAVVLGVARTKASRSYLRVAALFIS